MFSRKHQHAALVDVIEDGADDETACYHERLRELTRERDEITRFIEIEQLNYRRWLKCRADIGSLVFITAVPAA